MKIKYCTITGVDIETDITQINELSESYEFVEWGILLHHNTNRARYPTSHQINRILNVMSDNVNVSFHLCGVYTHISFLTTLLSILSAKTNDETRKFPVLESLQDHAHKINRVQVNNSFDIINQFKILLNLISQSPVPIITQHNLFNKTFTKYMENEKNHQVLYDNSRGKGVVTEKYDPPNDFTRMWGYAGGISDKNISYVLYKLRATLRGLHNDNPIWIDMESGVRTNNYFDATKVTKVLDEVEKWM